MPSGQPKIKDKAKDVRDAEAPEQNLSTGGFEHVLYGPKYRCINGRHRFEESAHCDKANESLTQLEPSAVAGIII